MTDADRRPDADALLARIQHDETRAARGRLRVYFGASAGVGKTYAMLAAARGAKAAGTDVVAGVVETHGRAETIAQLEGIETLPRLSLVVQGRPMTEFDLDAALARKPALLLVDELAHSNVAGSRHPKRWQDVDELLGAGIDVWTTLNVQHLESLNDIVGGITGIVVRETIPDTVFDRADEIVLVDTPADELLARLKAGKVYAEGAAERAAANFFRKGNLMALRELALRRTADRVEGDVQAYRADRAIGGVWKTEAALLCCIGPEASSEHVVRSAAQLAQQLSVSWHAVYVETPRLQRLAPAQREAILKSVRLAAELGASASVIAGQDVADALVAHARRHNLSRLVIGHHVVSRWRIAFTLAQRVGRRAPDIDLVEIGASPNAERRAAMRGSADDDAARRPSTAGYALALGLCAAVTAIAFALEPLLALPNTVMLFLLGVVVVALRWGRGPAVLAAVANVASFDFFFVPPRFSFAVSDAQYLLTFAVMLVVGIVIGQLTAGLRFQARVASHRERRSNALFEVARDLSSQLAVEQVVATAEAAVGREFRAEVRIDVMDDADRLQHADRAAAAGFDAGTARWVLDRARPAGLGTDTLPGSAWLYLPLVAPMRTRGVMALKPDEPRLLLVPEQRRQLETFAALTAIALERVHYVEVAQQATVQMESERLRNALLAALSHDLRTPLAGLAGAAETLALSGPLSTGQAEIAASLHGAALRMSTQVDNLLDMARIESGQVKLRREWQSVEEIVGSALRIARPLLGARSLRNEIPADLPLVECDAVLIERVLVNLLENAGKYTPPDAHIAISARAASHAVTISVVDDGPGIRAGQERAIFDKFTRGERESARGGVGLGLAICKAIVEAHGGRVIAENVAPHGAAFRLSLPLGAMPPVEVDEPKALAGTA